MNHRGAINLTHVQNTGCALERSLVVVQLYYDGGGPIPEFIIFDSQHHHLMHVHSKAYWLLVQLQN